MDRPELQLVPTPVGGRLLETDLELTAELAKRYQAAGGQYYVCPICFHAKQLDEQALVAGAELAGTVPMWQWIGDEGATTFSY